jgi:adenosyl cobinamide kinase/adenosyl cobinamide phosphate guanylyltransferase/NaMN:DMB phosphoribosyltransferase
MSSQSGRRFLVLGGIRSGKSALAEQLVSGFTGVRYIATAAYVATAGADGDDPEWEARIAAHRERRPSSWSTEEVGTDPAHLITLLTEAKPDDTVLVDDLGGWLTATLEAAGVPAATSPAGAGIDDRRRSLAVAVQDCPAGRLVLVSPEVGLSVVPATVAGRAFADGIGEVNQAVAAACDAVVLVVAGQPTWLKGAGEESVAAPGTAPTAGPAAATWADTDTVALPIVAVSAQAGTRQEPIAVGMSLPMPDEDASAAAGERLATLDVAGSGLGTLAPVVRFAAGTQGQPVPRPWQSIRMFVLHADHDGDVAAGDSPAASARRLAAVERGEGAWALLAGAAGADVQTVRCPGSGAAIEYADALRELDVETALAYGWQLAGSAVDAGTDLIVLGASGAGAEAAAVAVIVTATSGEAAALLGRVIAPGGRIDDAAWMRRCAAIRDALHRVRSRARDPQAVLGMLGGADHAVATGLLLGAVSRRTPVLLDGPVGVAAALVARDFGAQTRHWILLPDTGGHPAVRLGAEILGATPVLDLKLGLGEGATALAALPLLRSALTLAATLPEAPNL